MGRLLFIVLLFMLISCDDNLELGSKCQNVTVDFYTSHPTLTVTEAVFDTLFEQVLFKEGYNEGGATFETVSEQVLVRSAHKQYCIARYDSISVYTNIKDSLVEYIPCIDYYNQAEFTDKEAEYEVRTWQRLIENGSGEYIEPQYNTRSFLRLQEDAFVSNLEDSTRSKKSFLFTIPSNENFDDYLRGELSVLDSLNCFSIDHYKVR